jgi:hypothetical protein
MVNDYSASALHVKQAVNRGEFSVDPFPCLFVKDVIPDSLYSQLLDAWPIFQEMWLPVPSIGRVDLVNPHLPEYLNKWVSVERTSLTTDQVQSWNEFRTLINGTFFKESFFKFKPYLEAHGREILDPAPLTHTPFYDRIFRKRPDLSFWRNAVDSDFSPGQQFLVNRKDLSVLSPHVDPPRFSFTLIFYFASDLEHQHLGTTLFRQTATGRARLPIETDLPDAQYADHYNITCEKARDIPFVPNAAVLFLNGLHSWHGQHLSEILERRTYNSFFIARDIEAAMRLGDVEKIRASGYV